MYEAPDLMASVRKSHLRKLDHVERVPAEKLSKNYYKDSLEVTDKMTWWLGGSSSREGGEDGEDTQKKEKSGKK